jgi:hypothetical protein
VDGATDVPLDALITIVFDEPVDMSGAEHPIALSNDIHQVIGEVLYNTDSTKISFTPLTNMENSSVYNVVLSGDITDRSGNAIEEMRWSFTTVGDIDPPNVISTYPENEAIEIPTNVVITITFDEPLDSLSVTNESITLASGSDEVTGEVIYHPDSQSLLFTPDSFLAFHQSYQFKLSDHVLDTAGNPVEDMSWNFTTTVETGPARYLVIFDAVWSSATHSEEFPSDNPHLSGLVGMTHLADTSLFKIGSLASTGIKDMAELGSKSILEMEIAGMIDLGVAQYYISGGGINPSPGSITLEIDIDIPHSYTTIVSMIAPSPDWFVSVEDLNLYEDGRWVSDTTLNVIAYDAGADSGTTFKSSNLATDPPVDIYAIVELPLAVDSVVAPMGSMRFTRIE